MFYIFYISILLIFSVYSYGFVDANFPFSPLPDVPLFVRNYRALSTTTYIGLMMALFFCYGRILWNIKFHGYDMTYVIRFILITGIILLMSYPMLSNDIFNYIATAKVTFFYKENPYIIMPIHIPNEQMLAFLHASNKVALYGPVWIILTVIPHFLGFGNLIVSIYTFKLFVGLFYAGLVWFIWKLSNHDPFAVAFFALNPLVVSETLIAGHNDVVMMFFVLLSWWLLQKKKIAASLIALILSILIKYASIILLPVYAISVFLMIRKRSIDWEKMTWWCALSMYSIFLLSPLREEMYSWYFIWPLTYVSLIYRKHIRMAMVTLAFSFGLTYRFAPYVFTGMWGGITPLVKKIVSLTPPIIVGVYYAFRKKV